MSNTTEKGNSFRDLVEILLRTSGFRTETEAKIAYKNVDVSAVWLRDKFGEAERYGIEAKDYDGNLPLAQCTQFAADYGSLITNNHLDYAWLVSKGDFTPAGREAANSGRGLRAFTFAELQRRVLLIDGYLHDLKKNYDLTELSKYYIRPENKANQDLEDFVYNWIAEERPPPLFVLAPYGKGKSTFAKQLASAMAEKALNNPFERVPLLFPLGEIVNEQSLDGLFGKVLASQHRVENYHYETVRELNRLGRFLIIYDGFDEMKHGMTIEKFQRVMTELMKIDEGDSRILVLGRDTAFHDDHEFKLIIEGKQRTFAGNEVIAQGRRPYRHVELRGFTVDEAHQYVRNYFPILATKIGGGEHRTTDWIAARISELLSGRFDELLERPVHAEMLCQIALQSDDLSDSMTVSELYDRFVHYLLEREVSKIGRDAGIPSAVRRGFNASLAWWLWERGGASTTVLGDIPQALCTDAIGDVDHTMSQDELRRELIQGCLIEKGGTTIYFGHRSLQEFLVAEYLIDTDLLQSLSEKPGWLNRISKIMTTELADFIIGSLSISEQRAERASYWFDGLSLSRVEGISGATLEFLVRLWNQFRPHNISDVCPRWVIWLNYCLTAERADFSFKEPFTIKPLSWAFQSIRDEQRDAPAAMQILARNLMSGPRNASQCAIVLAAAFPIDQLGGAVFKAQKQRSWRHLVKREDDYRLWSLIRSWKVIQKEGEDTIIRINPLMILNDAERVLPSSFSRESIVMQGSDLTVTPQQLYQAFSTIDPNFDGKQLDKIRPYFNSQQIRSQISPIEVEVRKAK